MNLFDPSRPKIGDRPALVWNGRIVCVAPQILTFPSEEGEHACHLEVMVAIAPNTARWLSLTVFDVHNIFDSYRNDPEKVLMDLFQWHYTAFATKATVKQKLSLDDLGDLE